MTTDTPPAAPTAADYAAALTVLDAPCRMSACQFGDALCPICIASKVVARAVVVYALAMTRANGAPSAVADAASDELSAAVADLVTLAVGGAS